MIRQLSAMAAASLLLAACTKPQGPVSTIDRVKPGDNMLSCEQIKDDIGKMDKVLANAVGAQRQSEADQTALGTATSAGGIAGAYAGVGNVTGMLGLFGADTMNQQSNQQGQAAQDAEDAKARRENLTALGNAKNCFAAPASVTTTPAATPAKARKK